MAGRRLQEKVAVVTGAGRGIGEAYALALAAEGARVVVNDVGAATEGGNRNTSAADGVVDRIRAGGGAAVANYDDVSDFRAAERIMQTAGENFGRLDILVANAGIIRPTSLFEADEEDWSQVMAVHASGTFNCLRHAAPLMIAQRGGRIITTGYGAGEGDPERVGSGRGSHPGLGVYRAAKAAILVLTLNAASELRPFGITVNSIMPSATSTRMQAAFYVSLADRGISATPEQGGWPEALPPATIPPLGVYLCTEEAGGITGRSFSVYGQQLRVASAPTQLSELQTEADRWSLDELSERVPQWLSV